MNFKFINEEQINESKSLQYSSWSDSHVHITPNTKLGVLSFDSNDNEFFEELDSIDQYDLWTQKEKQRSRENIYCRSCKYIGSCYTDHICVPKEDPTVNSRDGQYLLLEKFKLLESYEPK